MKRQFLFITSLIILSCSGNYQPKSKIDKKKDTIVAKVEKVDSVKTVDVVDKFSLALKYLDSNRFYAKKCDEYKEKMYQANIDYLASNGGEKYKRLYYKYQRIYSYYVNKTNRFNDSLQALAN